ncbi:hypothetical protein KR222_007157, partial [Zaprionus bogoriensis]
QPAACVCCNESGHFIYSCNQFLSLTRQFRLRDAKRLTLCINCLKPGHQMRNSKAGSCRTCGRKHHSLVHFESQPTSHLNQNPTSETENSTNQPSCSSQPVNITTSTSLITQNSVSDAMFLPTAIVNLKNRSGAWIPCRALLDSGSQLHIVTSRLAHQLQLPRQRSTAAVAGIGDSRFVSAGFSVSINLKSLASDYSVNISALVAPTITDNPPNLTVCSEGLRIPANIKLADPEFYKSQNVDLLIGASLFFDLLCVGQIKLDVGLPLLQKTRLGWIVTGGGSDS